MLLHLGSPSLPTGAHRRRWEARPPLLPRRARRCRRGARWKEGRRRSFQGARRRSKGALLLPAVRVSRRQVVAPHHTPLPNPRKGASDEEEIKEKGEVTGWRKKKEEEAAWRWMRTAGWQKIIMM